MAWEEITLCSKTVQPSLASLHTYHRVYRNINPIFWSVTVNNLWDDFDILSFLQIKDAIVYL